LGKHRVEERRDASGVPALGLWCAAEPKVGDFGHAAWGDQDVGGLQISVEDRRPGGFQRLRRIAALEREIYFKSHISLWEHSSHFRLIGRGVPSVSVVSQLMSCRNGDLQSLLILRQLCVLIDSSKLVQLLLPHHYSTIEPFSFETPHPSGLAELDN